MYLKYVLCYKFTDNIQNADDTVFDERVQNVRSVIHDNLRLCTGNITGNIKILSSTKCCLDKHSITYTYLTDCYKINTKLKHTHL